MATFLSSRMVLQGLRSSAIILRLNLSTSAPLMSSVTSPKTTQTEQFQNIEGKFKDLQILVARKEHREEMLRHVAEVYVRNEPLAMFHNAVDDPKYVRDEVKFASEALDDPNGLSLVTLDSKDQIAGIRISLKFHRSQTLQEPKMEHYDNDIFHLFKILYDLESQVQPNLFDRFGVDEMLELRILSIDPKYWKIGLGSQLYIRNKLLAKSKGLKLAKVFFSGAFAQGAAEKTGFEIVNSISYDDYQYNGKFILKDMPEPHRMSAMAISVL